MNEIWEERAKKPKSFDVISIMAHGEATKQHDVAGADGNPDPVPGRRQRHHPQFHDRRAVAA